MQHRGFSSRLSSLAIIIVLAFSTVAPAWSQSPNAAAQERTPAGVGMQLAALGATIPYFVGKGAFAIGGGIVGGCAYLFSGLNEQAAKSIWIPSMYGTYILTPEHLTGDRSVHFLGVAAEGAEEPASTEPVNTPIP